MTPNQALRRWKKACKKWIDLLWISDYTHIYTIYEEKRVNDVPSGGQEAAEVDVNTRYKWAHFQAYKEYVDNATDNSLDETACHEVVHALVAPFIDVTDAIIDELPRSKRSGYKKWNDAAKERVVTHIEQVARSLYKAKGKDK